MSAVMLVDAFRLHETPLAFQQYVAEFFLWKMVLGRECWYASTTTYSRDGFCKGRAPSHSVELMRFKDGLPEGTSLNEWIYEAMKDDMPLPWVFYGPEVP